MAHVPGLHDLLDVLQRVLGVVVEVRVRGVRHGCDPARQEVKVKIFGLQERVHHRARAVLRNGKYALKTIRLNLVFRSQNAAESSSTLQSVHIITLWYI